MKKVSGPEKVRVHGHDCIMTRRKHGKGYVGTTSKIRRRYVTLPILGPKFAPKMRAESALFDGDETV
jgi:hypothetical protein